ncbi:MAG: F0F1 ATP synthase subunit alpha [Candidatus Omnitrophota bacterium]|nr:MAG: F0F1 ATP synthase subunit alpha [Candidatus Omnitrophota bacterium]
MKIEPFEIKEAGKVTEIKKGIIKVSGLPNCVHGQQVEVEDKVKGITVGFSPDEVVAVILGEETSIDVGDNVWARAESFQVPVGEAFLGRIINCLGEPIDGKSEVLATQTRPIFCEASGIMDRVPITEQLYTGTRILDTCIPIGQGQRELIIGDRVTGKTTLAIDTIINQKDKDAVCIYCWIGGSVSALSRITQVLYDKAALDYSIVVAAPASSPPGQQYLAPYAAAAIGEYFMYRGRRVVVVFDDLTKHAWVWRQLCLLLERPPGREAYPGDIFYIHSQLMERAGKLNVQQGGGSMTFLPIIETQQGDVTGYIPSNLVSMTDGQIYLSTALFHEGFKPAIDLGLSVSRIGSKVQNYAMREVSGKLRLEYAQFRELQRLSRLKTRVADEVSGRIRKGEVLRELFIQEAHDIKSWQETVILFYAYQRNILDVLPTEALAKFKSQIYQYFLKNQPVLMKELTQEQTLTKGITTQLDHGFLEFLKVEKLV